MDKMSYYNKNKEMRKQYGREYYLENREKMKKYQKEYQAKYREREGFKEKKAAYMKEYSKNYNRAHKPDPIKQAKRMKEYFAKNKEKMNNYWKEYRQSDRGKKVMRINNWKQIGVIDTDFDLLYDQYKNETHCWICGCQYNRPRHKHLDHDHETGEVRYICCMECNIKVLGKKRGSKQFLKSLHFLHFLHHFFFFTMDI